MRISTINDFGNTWNGLNYGMRSSRIPAEDVLSLKEKNFFNHELNTHLNTDTPTSEIFSTQALTMLNVKELNFFSSSFRNNNPYTKNSFLTQKNIPSSVSIRV